MPGLGRRTFAPGEVLTATNVMGYLQDQAVMTFAGTAARGSAIGTAVSEGMVSYLADSDFIEFYNGTAWGALKNSVIQVVAATTSTQVNNSSSTFVDSGLTATITPRYASSRIAIFSSTNISKLNDGSTALNASVELLRNATRIYIEGAKLFTNSNSFLFGVPAAANVLDSPNTTSAITYKTRFTNNNAGTIQAQRDGSTSTMILMEIAN